MNYRIFRSNNYIFIVDEKQNQFEELCENVLVTKEKESSTNYTISFLRQETIRSREISQSFPDIPFANIYDEAGVAYPSTGEWELWYETNTGIGSLASSGTALSNLNPQLKTPNIIRTSASGNVNTVAATFYSVSVANVGSADGSILGGVNNLKSGEILNFDSGSLNNTFNSFAYDATGTEFIITFIS